METTSSPPTLDPASDTAVSDLAAMLERRREQLGIDEPGDATCPAVRVPLAISRERQAELDAIRDREVADCRNQKRLDVWRSLLASAGHRYESCRFTTFKADRREQTQVIEALLEYTGDIAARRTAATGVVLYGPCGTGKDHLAFGIAREAVAAHMSVVWLNGQDWYGKIRDAMDGETPEAALINRIARPDFAFISDPLPPIGNLSQHQATMLYRAVEARYAARRPTVVTVNVATDEEADSRLGVPTWDRLCHDAWKIRCVWPSYRKPAKQIG